MASNVRKPGVAGAESVHDILRVRPQPLDVFFRPKALALIGASETPGSVGRTLLTNLVQNPFGGTVFPVNIKRTSVLGIKAYPRVTATPEPVDLAIVATPAPTVPQVIRECADAGVPAAIVISAGFKEIGASGADLERHVLEEARRGRMRIIGPNCLGIQCPLTGLNATFASRMALTGRVGFISQSGALGTAILDWSLRERVGFSAFISLGSMLDVGWGDLIDYLGDDPHTTSILIYMETIGDARSFLSAAREVALNKPIIVLKAGRTEEAARAAASHTGSLAGSDQVLEAAFRRTGVLRVQRIADLFYMAEVLAKQPRPQGPRLAIVTNAGGPGVLATDALVGAGGQLAELSPDTLESLDKFLPPAWSHGNPVDILGDAGPDRYAGTVQWVAQDPGNDGLLVILTPQAMTEPAETARRLQAFAKLPGKPILASWMGGSDVAVGEKILSQANIPTFPYPDTAVRAFDYMWRYAFNLQGLYETPALSSDAEGNTRDRSLAKQIIAEARREQRTLLNEFESKKLLQAYGLPAVETRRADNETVAVEAADALGYPVAAKLLSRTVTHKSDVGGVKLHLKNAEEVRAAFGAIKNAATIAGVDFLGVTVQRMVSWEGYELILGSSVDPQFGPVLLFGAGGQLVELFKDHALALPPLNSTLARRLMEQTLIYQALQGVRGRKPVDLAALELLLARFSQLVVEQRWIKEIDINPLLASPEGFMALDARVILNDPDLSEQDLPRPAIRPYPARYAASWTLRDGTTALLRPIRPEDEPLLAAFHEALSEQSVQMRFFSSLKLSTRVAHERLLRRCFVDYDRDIALVALRLGADGDSPVILGIGRLSKLHGFNEAEFALLVRDDCQRKGLGTELVKRLIQIARDERLDCIRADILPENEGMLTICKRLGFRLSRSPEDPTVLAELMLSGAGTPSPFSA